MATGSGIEDGTGIASVQGLCYERIVVDSCGLAKIVNFPHPHGVGSTSSHEGSRRRAGKCLAAQHIPRAGQQRGPRWCEAFLMLSAEA
jgi:hypothetical protein